MSYWDSFKARTHANGDTERDQIINDHKDFIESDFKNSPSYYQVDLNGSPIDVQIVDDSQVRDEKILTTYYETPISLGNVITWKSDKWIVIHFDEMGEIYKRCKIVQCLGDIKWLNDDGFLRSVSFTYRTDSTTNFGVQNGQVIDLGNERRQIIIPSNVDTKKLKKKKRFIIDDRAWEITAIDRVKKGIVNITLMESEVSAADNVELGIADYDKLANYTIRITDGETFSMRANQSKQLSAEVKNNGVIVDKPVVWSVSDSSIASINQSGLLSGVANGTVTVTVRLAVDNAVMDTATVNVEFATVDHYSIELDSSLDVLVNTSKTFTVVVRNNLVVDPSRTVQIYIYADDGVSPPTAATVLMNSPPQFTLKAGSKAGWVKAYIVLVGSNPIVSQTFRIQVESLI